MTILKKSIRLSKSFVEISILFVFKKKRHFTFLYKLLQFQSNNDKKSLSFFLISKILNYFAKIKYFSKIDIKNIYYRIRKKKNTNKKSHFVYETIIINI